MLKNNKVQVKINENSYNPRKPLKSFDKPWRTFKNAFKVFKSLETRSYSLDVSSCNSPAKQHSRLALNLGGCSKNEGWKTEEKKTSRTCPSRAKNPICIYNLGRNQHTNDQEKKLYFGL